MPIPSLDEDFPCFCPYAILSIPFQGSEQRVTCESNQINQCVENPFQWIRNILDIQLLCITRLSEIMNGVQWRWSSALMREMRNIARNSPYATEVEDLTCAEIQDRFQHMGLDVIRGKHTSDGKGLFLSSFVDGRMEYRREPREGFFEEAFEPYVDVIACREEDELILRYELKTFSIYPDTRRWKPPYRRQTIEDIEKVGGG